MYEQDHSNGDDETKKLAEIGTITKKMNKICDSDYTEHGNLYNSDANSVMRHQQEASEICKADIEDMICSGFIKPVFGEVTIPGEIPGVDNEVNIPGEIPGVDMKTPGVDIKSKQDKPFRLCSNGYYPKNGDKMMQTTPIVNVQFLQADCKLKECVGNNKYYTEQYSRFNII